MTQTRTFSGTRSLGTKPAVLRGLNATPLHAIEREYADTVLDQNLVAAPDEEMGAKRFYEPVQYLLPEVSRYRALPKGESVAAQPTEEMPEIPSELIHLGAGISNFAQPLDRCVPVHDFSPEWDGMFARICDARG
jgi:hypothetical protein